jgi:hypothetical protein
VLQGVEAGAPCDLKLRTAPSCEGDFGFYCAGAGDAGNRCAKANVVPANAACGDVNADGTPADAGAQHLFAKCGAGSECDPPNQRGAVCVPAAADGMPCDTAVGPPCLKPATCVNTDSGTKGTCLILETNRTCD